jgi:CTP:molybdopterin cytidylyltransferase MocA
MVAGLVLAAGAGRRFGGVKQLAPFRGRPLVEWPLHALAEAPVDELIVVLGARAAEIEASADLRAARVVRCAAWADGLARSLATGIEAADDLGADAVAVVLGDQPLVEAEAVRRVIAARGDDAVAVRATYDGRPGHPVLLERRAWPVVLSTAGDQGAAAALRDLSVALVACDDAGSDADADTPEALAVLETRDR